VAVFARLFGNPRFGPDSESFVFIGEPQECRAFRVVTGIVGGGSHFLGLQPPMFRIG
jgi:hypothetical protein